MEATDFCAAREGYSPGKFRDGRLTERQAVMLVFIVRYMNHHGFAPTLREIGAELGIKSPNGVSDYLWAMRRKGFLSWTAGRHRSLRVLEVAP